MKLAERYRQALVYKLLDVEELIDRFFHRPLAALVVALLIPLPVSSNQVTLGSLVCGWLGSFFLYRAFFVGDPGPTSMWLLAGALLFAAVILDCADGQLARARGGGSRVGRILDGFVDVLVLFPAYVILGFGIDHIFGRTWLFVAAVAGVSTWIHCIVYDKIKNLYLARAMPDAGGAEGTETVAAVRRELEEATKSGSLLERFLLWVYVGYLQVQDRLASGSTQKRTDKLGPDAVAQFRREHGATMHLASYLGLGTHMFIIYGGIALMVVDLRAALAMQVIFATVLNLLMVVVLWRSRRFQNA